MKQHKPIKTNASTPLKRGNYFVLDALEQAKHRQYWATKSMLRGSYFNYAAHNLSDCFFLIERSGWKECFHEMVATKEKGPG